MFDPHTASYARVVPYAVMPHWHDQNLSTTLQMFQQQCTLHKLPARYDAVCQKSVTAKDARKFFELYFVPVALIDEKTGTAEGMMTGYFEPLLKGSLTKSEHFKYPIYARPDTLVTVELERLYPQLHGKKIRGRLENGRLIPFYSRKEINENKADLPVLCYVESAIDRFFLQVQGSGRIALDNGEVLFVGYAGENGHPYRSIGKMMVEREMISQENISLQSIRKWLENHPKQCQDILEYNPSFVFFSKRSQGATGTLGLELTPLHSVAVDRTFIPLGTPIFYVTKDPLDGSALANLALAQDTGGAIKGQVRADLFWGFGTQAQAHAGAMKSPLKLWMLVLRSVIDQNP